MYFGSRSSLGFASLSATIYDATQLNPGCMHGRIRQFCEGQAGFHQSAGSPVPVHCLGGPPCDPAKLSGLDLASWQSVVEAMVGLHANSAINWYGRTFVPILSRIFLCPGDCRRVE